MDTILIDSGTVEMIRVFIWTGTVAHLIDPRIILPDETAERRTAICGQRPFWPGVWFGTLLEHAAQAQALPLCGRCALVAATREVSGEST